MTQDGCETDVEDKRYNIGDISQKTGLQKTANGWVKPRSGKAPGAKKPAGNKPTAASKHDTDPLTYIPKKNDELRVMFQKEKDPAKKAAMKKALQKQASMKPREPWSPGEETESKPAGETSRMDAWLNEDPSKMSDQELMRRNETLHSLGKSAKGDDFKKVMNTGIKIEEELSKRKLPTNPDGIGYEEEKKKAGSKPAGSKPAGNHPPIVMPKGMNPAEFMKAWEDDAKKNGFKKGQGDEWREHLRKEEAKNKATGSKPSADWKATPSGRTNMIRTPKGTATVTWNKESNGEEWYGFSTVKNNKMKSSDTHYKTKAEAQLAAEKELNHEEPEGKTKGETKSAEKQSKPDKVGDFMKAYERGDFGKFQQNAEQRKVANFFNSANDCAPRVLTKDTKIRVRKA